MFCTINSNHIGKKIGRLYINEQQIVCIAEETAYLFFGEMHMYPLKDIIHPDDSDFFTSCVNNITSNEKKQILIRFKHNDEYVWCYIAMAKSKKYRPDVKLTKLDIYDISYVVDALNTCEEENKKYSAILKMLTDMTFEYDLNTQIITIKNISRGSDKCIVCEPLEDWCTNIITNKLISENDLSIFQKLISDIKRGSSDFFHSFKSSMFTNGKEVETIHIKGTAIENNMRFSKIVGTISNVNLALSKDISFLTQINSLDPLTGLLNKRSITEYAMAKTANKDPNNKFSLIMMDLDYFKDINDTYGHMFGDDVLVTVSAIIKTVVGDRGKAGRVGGDEFLIVLDGETGRDSIFPILKSLRTHIQWAYADSVSALSLTTSIGISSFPTDAEDYETLFKIADKCLYIAKAKGRNRYIVYRPDMHGSVENILSDGYSINVEKQRTIPEKTQDILDFIDKFSRSDKSAIPAALEYLLPYYDVDRITVFYGEGLPVAYNISNTGTENILPLGSLVPTYLEKFKCNIFSIGNYTNIQGAYPEFYARMVNSGSYSMLQYLINDIDGNPLGIIMFSTYKRYKKWADGDMPYISVACKLIEQLLNS